MPSKILVPSCVTATKSSRVVNSVHSYAMRSMTDDYGDVLSGSVRPTPTIKSAQCESSLNSKEMILIIQRNRFVAHTLHGLDGNVKTVCRSNDAACQKTPFSADCTYTSLTNHIFILSEE